MARNGSLAADLLKGAIAGAVGTWAMEKATTYMWEHEPPEARQRYQEVTGGKYPPIVAAEKLEQAAGLTLSDEQRKKLAMAIHWGLGIGAGIMYALLRRWLRGVDRYQGLGFGTGFWALVDEGMTPAMGLAKGPTAYPWQAHARGLAGHLAYGLAADTALDVLDRVA
jgi:hypothetical protein